MIPGICKGKKNFPMSWQEINRILTRAMIDAQFAGKLLADPIRAISEAGFDLTVEELQILREAKAKDIVELSQIILRQIERGES